MRHASLFSGIGGPEVAAAMLGWENLFHCEINEFGRKVLDYWFPNSKSYEDITKTDFSEWRGKVDVLTGGFPCQPFSYAGKRRGADDDRYLWPYMFKAIDAIRPAWIVAENVAGITTMVEQGEVSEMGGQASMFEEVDDIHRYRLEETFTLQRICDDLEGHGYSVQPVLVPACAVGAPHRRDRVFIVARRIASDTDNGADRRIAREDEGNGGEERIQERHEVRKPDEPNQVRPEMRGLASDTCDNERDGLCRVAGQKRPFREEREHRKIVSEEGHGMDLHADIERTGEHRNASDTHNEGLERHGGQELQGHQRWLSSEEHAACGSIRFVADTDSRRVQGFHSDGELCEERNNKKPFANTCGDAFSDTNCSLLQPGNIERPSSGKQGHGIKSLDSKAGLGRWDSFPTVSPVHRGNDGIPFDVDRLAIPFSKWRTESIKAYGNAIVPQVMYEIFRFIEIVEKGENV